MRSGGCLGLRTYAFQTDSSQVMRAEDDGPLLCLRVPQHQSHLFSISLVVLLLIASSDSISRSNI